MTKRWQVDPVQVDPGHPAIREAADKLRQGEPVAFPTETVYGLGADAGNTEAVERVFAAKGRPADNPLIVHIADREQLVGLTAEPNELSKRLMDAFWPGPLTLILPVMPGAVSPRVTAGLSTVGVRMPDDPVALALIRASGRPLAAPSANRSGRPSPTRAEHVLDDLSGAIAGVVDGGATGVGVESTVVEAGTAGVHILRPGGVSAEDLRRALPGIAVTVAGEMNAGADPLTAASANQPPGAAAPETEAPKSPGVKYKHYAPKGALTLVTAREEGARTAWINAELARRKAQGERTGVLAAEERAARYPAADAVVVFGREAEPQTFARGLYDALRRFDEAGVTFILAEAVDEAGIGAAVMNRLRKAAGGRVIRLDDPTNPGE
ncbi:L-threonylcarbamoyladenylate synthase [Gorillibacterium sp. CAU 1737]|uniref:L-threonylcarbamoyladenylate synthase n=1 Tax=Gorillibacterium sp. CAU 1737 TaxID=3140362 RepID=UPI003260CCFB